MADPQPAEVVDIDGRTFRVVAAEPSRDGRVIVYRGAAGRGAPVVVLTAELADLLRSLPRRGALEAVASLGLRLSPQTLTRLRRRLGLGAWSGNDEWWQARRDELAAIGPPEFAAKYGIGEVTAYDWCRKLGIAVKPQRDYFWWLAPPVVHLLTDPHRTMHEIAADLGVSVPQAYGLRRKLFAKLEAAKRHGNAARESRDRKPPKRVRRGPRPE